MTPALAALTSTALVAMVAPASTPTTSGATEMPRPGGTLTVSDSIDVTSVDPQVSNELGILYTYAEGLTGLSDAGELKPFLARSYEASTDAKSYLFRLRDGVKLHNGRTLTADDVKWSLERIKNPDTKAFRGNDLKAITVDVLDPLTVRIALPQPNAALPAILASCFILAPESAGADGKVTKPIGTGPFAFESWTPGQELRLGKHATYWRERMPYLDAVVYKPIPDSAARLTALRSGAVDIAASIAATDLPLIARDMAIKTQFTTPNIVSHLTFNTKNPVKPLDDPRVRRAVALVLDKRQFVVTAVGDNGPGRVNNQFWDDGDFWRLAVPDPFAMPDEAGAKRLLAEAGVSGFSTNIVTWSSGRPLAEVAQARLRMLGITAQIDFLPDFASYLDRLKKYDYGMVLDSAFPRDDPAALMSFWDSQNANNLYRGGYGNPKVDMALAEANATADPAARKAAFARALNTVENEDVASVIVLSRKDAWANRTAVRGFTVGTGKLNRVDGGLAMTWLVR